jgi:hypothetical protein
MSERLFSFINLFNFFINGNSFFEKYMFYSRDEGQSPNRFS